MATSSLSMASVYEAGAGKVSRTNWCIVFAAALMLGVKTNPENKTVMITATFSIPALPKKDVSLPDGRCIHHRAAIGAVKREYSTEKINLFRF
jgi:hypothetical protein